MLLVYYHILLYPTLALWDGLSPRGQVYSAIQPPLPPSPHRPRLLWGTPEIPPLLQWTLCLEGGTAALHQGVSVRGEKVGFKARLPKHRQESEATISPNTSPSLLYAATAFLINGKLLSRIPLCTPLMRLPRPHFGHWVNIYNCFHRSKLKGFFSNSYHNSRSTTVI